MREGIAKHGGYEINTEGDAFQIAFPTVHQVAALPRPSQQRFPLACCTRSAGLLVADLARHGTWLDFTARCSPNPH